VPPRPANVRFYFDEDVLGLAKVVAALRSEITYPGHPGDVVNKRVRPACVIASGVKDPLWIPVVANEGWLIVTRDSAIQRRRAEVAAVRNNGARMVALAGADAGGKWEQLEVLMINWRRIQTWAGEPGPFIYSVTRAGTPRRIPLDE
jgi:hypothetical protein